MPPGSGCRRRGPHREDGAARDLGTPAGGQRSAVTGTGSMSSKDWFSPAMAHTNE
jgi:hypothetical protein